MRDALHEGLVALYGECHHDRGEASDCDVLVAALAARSEPGAEGLDVERLRAIEAAAREAVTRWFNAEDASDDEAVSQALHDMRRFWRWTGGHIDGPAALAETEPKP